MAKATTLARAALTVLLIAAIAGPTLAEDMKIKFAENDWTGQLIDVNLAKIILNEHMGYQAELVFADYTGEWPALARGDLDVAMEIWPSISTASTEEWIDKKHKVEKIGDLGVTASAGWYVPTYVIKGDAARGIAPMAPDLKSYKDLNKYAKLFSRPETGDAGFCLDSIPTWELHNEDRIKNLGVTLKNVYAGSEGALMAEIDAAYTAGAPLLLCNLWTPHWVHAKYDLTEIELPPYSDECFASGRYDCDFATDTLFNVARVGFKAEHPRAYQFLKNMQLTADQQQAIMLEVDVKKTPVEQAVRNWMAANESVWKLWIPAQ